MSFNKGCERDKKDTTPWSKDQIKEEGTNNYNLALLRAFNIKNKPLAKYEGVTNPYNGRHMPAYG